jgi:hypothetical protein
VVKALNDVFSAGVEPLAVAVAREGFSSDGEPVGLGIPGGDVLGDELRTHGISQLKFSADVTPDDIMSMVLLLSTPPEEIRLVGGFGSQLSAKGVQGIAVTEVQLVIMDTATPDGIVGSGLGNAAPLDAETAEELANDPVKLGAWLAQAALGGATGLQGSVNQLVDQVGPQGQEGLAGTFATSFSDQPAETRDALLGLSMQVGPFRDLMGEMFRRQDANDIASSILGGIYGKNMLSLSKALTSLPLERLDEAVKAQIHAMLPSAGKSPDEAQFLDHMVEVRRRTDPEPSLAASDQTYLAVATAAAIKPDVMEAARRAVEASGEAINAAGVRTMFTLLDQQTNPEQLRVSAKSLTQMVTRLLIHKQLPLAEYVVAELAERSDRIPSAELLPSAATAEALASLIELVIADPANFEAAERLMQTFGSSAEPTFVAAAISHKAEGIKIAERLFGKRMLEPLAEAVQQAQWFQLGPVVTVLAQENDSRLAAAIQALMRRPDVQARKEIVNGLAAAGGQTGLRLLGEMVRDQSNEVAIAAARALAKTRLPGCGEAIAARLGQLDVDNNDYELAREFIQALAHIPDRAAEDALNKLASRRQLIKRGHFNDIQAAVASAKQIRARGTMGQ